MSAKSTLMVVLTWLSFSCIDPAQAQQESSDVPQWGRFEDPSGQAKLKVEASAVEITSGKNQMTAEDTLGKLPRIVRDVAGDFDVRVRVSGDFTAEYQSGVLLVFANHNEYARMTCGFGRYRAKQVSTGFMTRGEIIGGRFHRTTETSKWLRWQRVGDQLRSFYSHDGEKWHASANSQDITFKDGGHPSFDQPMQLMLMVHNRAPTPLTVRFEQFEITEGEGIEAITTVEDTDDPIAQAMKRVRMPLPPRDVKSSIDKPETEVDVDESWKSHEKLVEQTLDVLAEMIDAVESVLASSSNDNLPQIQSFSERAEKLGAQIKKLPPQIYEQRLAMLERVDEHHKQLQHRMSQYQQKIHNLFRKDPNQKVDPEIELQRRKQAGVIWGALTGSRQLAFRAGIPFTEEKAVLVNPQRVLVAPTGEVAVEMVLFRYRAEPNTPIYGGKEGFRLNSRHQLIERKNRFITADRETVAALVRSQDKSESINITRIPFAQGRFFDRNEDTRLWTLVSGDLGAPTTTRRELPAAFQNAAEFAPDSVPYSLDGKSLQLSFAGMMSWLSLDTANAEEKETENDIRDLIVAGKLNEATKAIAAARQRHPQSVWLARIGISIADAYRRAGQHANAQNARSDAIDFLLAMPEELRTRSFATLHALLINQLLYAQGDESIQFALSTFERSLKAFPFRSNKLAALRQARILTLASIGETESAHTLCEQDVSAARRTFEADPRNTVNRLALAQSYYTLAAVNLQDDQSTLKSLSDAAALLTHDWVVQHADNLDAVRQYLLINRALIVSTQTSAPRAALKRAKEVLATLGSFESSNRDPVIGTLIESERQKLEMLLTVLNADLTTR